MPFVRFRDCTCPEIPHSGPSPEWGDLDGDVVELRPHLPFEAAALTLRKFTDMTVDAATLLGADAKPGELELAITVRVQETIGPIFLKHGPVRWNLAEPLDIASLPFGEQYVIAEAANDLYTEEVVAPLVKRIAALSATGSTGKPRQSRSTRSASRRKPSGSSS